LQDLGKSICYLIYSPNVKSENTSKSRKPAYQRNYLAGFLENMGVKYYQPLASGISDVEAVVSMWFVWGYAGRIENVLYCNNVAGQ
jgi:hypothetical protein